jgi:NitT/TauT family transport system substrate-binding protein
MPQISRRQALSLGAGLLGATSLPRGARAEKSEIAVAIQYGIGYLPVMIVDRLGLFAKQSAQHGMPATMVLQRLSGATAINDALISRSIDIGAYGIPGMLIAHEKTVRSFNVSGLAALSALPYTLFANDPAIKTLADIRPQDRIAVTAPNTPQAELLRMAALKTFGDAHRLDTQMVPLPHPDATIALMSGRTITLYIATPPFSQVLEASPKVHAVTTSTQIAGEDMTGALLGSTGRFAMDNPTLTAAFVAALEEADAIIQTDPVRAAALYRESEPTQLKPGEIEAILRQYGSTFAIAPSGTMVFARFMHENGEIKLPLDRWQNAYLPPVSEGRGS